MTSSILSPPLLAVAAAPLGAIDAVVVHAAATWALVGLIWIVQLVTYPSFALVGSREIAEYHEAHCRRIAWIVGPLMGIELLSAALILVEPPAEAPPFVLAAAMGLLVVNWLCTGLVSVPLHARIVGRGRDRAQLLLVLTNWIRTASWSLRGVLVLFLLA